MKKIIFIIGSTFLFFLSPNSAVESGEFPRGRYKTDHEGKPFIMEFKADGNVNGYYEGEQILTGTYFLSGNHFTWEWVSTCKEEGYREPTIYLWTRNEDGSLTFQLVGDDTCSVRKEVFDNKTYVKLIS
jgi:hypothetical protein